MNMRYTNLLFTYLLTVNALNYWLLSSMSRNQVLLGNGLLSSITVLHITYSTVRRIITGTGQQSDEKSH